MGNPGNANKVAEALDYLRREIQLFAFDNQERVVHVAVYDSSNGDKVAEQIGHMRDLQKLILNAADLTDEGLGKLKPLANLRELSLASPCISGSGLSHLVGMNKLTDLVLYGSACLDEKAFGYLSQLRRLKRLNIYGGAFCDADLVPLGALINLEELEISDNDKINGTFATCLTGLPRLRELGPGKRHPDEGLASIAKLVHLTTLFIEGTFSDAGLRQIGLMQSLEVLYVTSESVTAEGLAVIAKLKALLTLGLDVPLLTDDCIASLADCRSLAKILLIRTGITRWGVKRLRRALPDCEVRVYPNQRRTNAAEDSE